MNAVGGPERLTGVVLPQPAAPPIPGAQVGAQGENTSQGVGSSVPGNLSPMPAVGQSGIDASRRGERTMPADDTRQKNAALTKQDIKELADRLNKVVDAMDIQARFSVHEATKQIIVRLINVKDNSVIREIPPRKMLDMVAQMMKFVGLLVDEKV